MTIGSDTDCCGVKIISSLEDHDDNPKGAMIAFCKLNAIQTYRDSKRVTELAKPAAFYIFTAVIGCAAPEERDCGCMHNYGNEFADFIRVNKLGMIKETPSRRNRVNEPDHTIKVWVWSPNPKGLQAWWDENKGK